MSYMIDNIKDNIKPFFELKEVELIQGVIKGKRNFVLNLDEIKEWNQDLADDLIENPSKYEIASSKAIQEILHTAGKPTLSMESFEFEFVGDYISFVKIRNIGHKQIGRLIKIRGLVTQTGKKSPFAMEVVFKCSECGEPTPPIIQENPFALSKPFGKCDSCKNRVNWIQVPELSKYKDSQEIYLQELYEDVAGHSLKRERLIAFKDFLINKVNAGDVVEIVGVVKLISKYRRRAQSRFSDTYIEVYSIDKKSKDPEDLEIASDEEQEIISLSKQSDIYEKMIENLAPSIYGKRHVKEACLLSMFGGVRKERRDITIRGQINTLLCGDPSTAKSQLLEAVAKLSPRGCYATGRGSSAAGLTASVNKDENGQWMLSAGVLPLADKGIACIDEFDKMRSEDRGVMHQVMEQQKVSVDKAGIHTTLMARTAILASCNPIFGKYDKYKSVFENLSNFPVTLFSRFDLIFIFLDEPDEEEDEKIASQILDYDDNQKEQIDRDLFKKYIAYSKRIKPKMTQEVKNYLKQQYISMRKQTKTGKNKEKAPIAARQLEGLVRLSEARARSLLKDKVDLDDAKRAVQLFNKFLEEINFDIERLEGGKPKRLIDGMKVILDILAKEKNGLDYNEIMKQASEKGVSQIEFQKFFVALQKAEKVMELKGGYWGKL